MLFAWLAGRETETGLKEIEDYERRWKVCVFSRAEGIFVDRSERLNVFALVQRLLTSEFLQLTCE